MIKIDDEYIIDTDNCEYKLKYDFGGKVGFKTIAHCATLESALRECVNTKLREHVRSEELITLQDVIIKLNEIKKEVGVL